MLILCSTNESCATVLHGQAQYTSSRIWPYLCYFFLEYLCRDLSLNSHVIAWQLIRNPWLTCQPERHLSDEHKLLFEVCPLLSKIEHMNGKMWGPIAVLNNYNGKNIAKSLRLGVSRSWEASLDEGCIQMMLPQCSSSVMFLSPWAATW